MQCLEIVLARLVAWGRVPTIPLHKSIVRTVREAGIFRFSRILPASSESKPHSGPSDPGVEIPESANGPPGVPFLATDCAATFDSGCEIHFNRQVRQEHIVGSELIVGILKRHGISLFLDNAPQRYVFRKKC